MLKCCCGNASRKCWCVTVYFSLVCIAFTVMRETENSIKIDIHLAPFELMNCEILEVILQWNYPH